MSDPCKQEAPIAKLAERTEHQRKSIVEMAEALKMNNDLLKQVAEVLSDIRHLREDSHRNEKAINEAFERVRALELIPRPGDVIKSLAIAVDKMATRVDALEKQPGKLATKMWWMVFGVLAGATGSVISGMVIEFIKWSVK